MSARENSHPRIFFLLAALWPLFATPVLAQADSPTELLAQLERGGAALYRGFAQAETDPAKREALLVAARREEENAELLEGGG